MTCCVSQLVVMHGLCDRAIIQWFRAALCLVDDSLLCCYGAVLIWAPLCFLVWAWWPYYATRAHIRLGVYRASVFCLSVRSSRRWGLWKAKDIAAAVRDVLCADCPRKQRQNAIIVWNVELYNGMLKCTESQKTQQNMLIVTLNMMQRMTKEGGDDWLKCQVCSSWLHESCAEIVGIIIDDDGFACIDYFWLKFLLCV